MEDDRRDLTGYRQRNKDAANDFKGIRVNYKIKAPEVRVIGENGEMIGIMSVKEAVNIAQEEGLDLVEVNPKAVPPVCKIMDFGKYKYEKKKKEREAKKHQSIVEVKEIKFRPTTDDHDIDIKIRSIRRFLEEKNKAKLTIRFRGREIAHQEIGANLLMKIAEMVSDIGVITQQPRTDGKQMTMIISPKESAGVKQQGSPGKDKENP